MLKPIPTPHPTIMLGSLALLAGMFVYESRSGFHKPSALVNVFVMIAIASLCGWSRNRRAKEINRVIALSTPKETK